VPRRVLIVDDDPRFRLLAATLLEGLGCTVAAEAGDGAQALVAVRRAAPNVALVDVQLPDMDGLALARALGESDDELRIILTSTDPTLVPASALAESPAVAFLPKDRLTGTELAKWLDG
jgi:CheY-like chemotaxis protein